MYCLVDFSPKEDTILSVLGLNIRYWTPSFHVLSPLHIHEEYDYKCCKTNHQTSRNETWWHKSNIPNRVGFIPDNVIKAGGGKAVWTSPSFFAFTNISLCACSTLSPTTRFTPLPMSTRIADSSACGDLFQWTNLVQGTESNREAAVAILTEVRREMLLTSCSVLYSFSCASMYLLVGRSGVEQPTFCSSRSGFWYTRTW